VFMVLALIALPVGLAALAQFCIDMGRLSVR
jgi:hypothetical protein